MTQQTIGDLVSEINELRKTVLYCEAKILLKQITIQELLYRDIHVVSDLPQAAETKQDPPPVRSIIPVKIYPSVAKILEEVLPQLDGKVFWYSDIERKIKAGVYPGCRELIKRKTIVRCEGGFKRNV